MSRLSLKWIGEDVELRLDRRTATVTIVNTETQEGLGLSVDQAHELNRLWREKYLVATESEWSA